MSAPKRIQRKRTKGWRMPEGAVYVGRGSKWGNPFRWEDERELWRRADAGEVFDLAQDHDEEEPMTEGMIQAVDDLAKPTLARLKEIVGEIKSRERQAAALRVDAARFIAVLDALGCEVPDMMRQTTGVPRPPNFPHVPENERWTCTCGFRSQGRHPGLHAKRCATHKATVAMEEPHD